MNRKLAKLRLSGMATTIDQRMKPGYGRKMGLLYVFRDIAHR